MRPNASEHDPLQLNARTILNSLSAHIAILDENGWILETNQAWKSFARVNDYQLRPEMRRVNYLQICDTASGDSADRARKVAAGIRAVIAGEVKEFVVDYPCHSPTAKRWFYMRAILLSQKPPLRVVVCHENITPLKAAEEALMAREAELEGRKKSLEEANIALKVLLEQREKDKRSLEEKVVRNLKEQVLPFVEKLTGMPLGPQGRTYLQIIRDRLGEIVSPFLNRLSTANIFLTPQEIQVAGLVRDGKASKEIATVLNVSETTVHFHRKNLRKKLGLGSRRANLRAHLMSLAK
ncbi:MAG: LuxR C-terminal-related transcriptional regulator [Desulfobacterales bacterium]|nr:LuxR C-terminal-related transcriptional regulator [Desulfobacterales bacterium]